MTTTAALVTEYLDLKERASVVDERIKEIVGILRELGVGTHATEAGSVRVSQTSRFDPDVAATTLPAELAAACTETVITAAKAKQVLPPALYLACSRPSGDPRVTITAAT